MPHCPTLMDEMGGTFVTLDEMGAGHCVLDEMGVTVYEINGDVTGVLGTVDSTAEFDKPIFSIDGAVTGLLGTVDSTATFVEIVNRETVYADSTITNDVFACSGVINLFTVNSQVTNLVNYCSTATNSVWFDSEISNIVNEKSKIL